MQLHTGHWLDMPLNGRLYVWGGVIGFFCNIEETGVEGPMAASAFLLER